MWKNSVLETIGNTPLIKLNKITKDLPCTVLAKVEYFNPGNSIKDRMALKMLEVAEQEGKIKPGGTIIEGTSGNTGMGLALAASIKVWAIDSYGSLLKKYFDTGEIDENEVYPYISEGFGEDFVPANYDMRYIDCLLYTSPSPRDGLLSR